MTETTVSENASRYSGAERQRIDCNELEKQALAAGDHDTSLRHCLAKILCAGRYVRQEDGGDLTAERALLRYAAYTAKAVAIALNHGHMVEDEQDLTLYSNEAACVLGGLSELLDVAPRLIDSIDIARVKLVSPEVEARTDSDGDS